MFSLYIILENLKSAGYTENFLIRDGELTVEDQAINVEDIAIESVIKIEEEGMNKDHIIIYGLYSHELDARGTLVSRLSAHADPSKSDVIENIEQKLGDNIH